MTAWNIMFAVPSTVVLMVAIFIVTLLSIRWWGEDAVFSAEVADARSWLWLAASLFNGVLCARICDHVKRPVANFGLYVGMIAIVSYLLFVASLYLARRQYHR